MFVRRLLAALVLAFAAVAVPALALAHAEFVSSTPEHGAMLDVPPSEIVITFEGELQAEGSGFRVAGPGGDVGSGTLDLQVAERNVLRGAVSLTEPGVYTVKWTVVAADGDEQLGYFDFTIRGATVPTTALAAPPGPIRAVLTTIGAVMLAAAVLLVLRRRYCA